MKDILMKKSQTLDVRGCLALPRHFNKYIRSLVSETDYLNKLKRCILPDAFIEAANEKYKFKGWGNGVRPIERILSDALSYDEVFVENRKDEPISFNFHNCYNPSNISFRYSTWEFREIIGYYKHMAASKLLAAIECILETKTNDPDCQYDIKSSVKELVYLEKVEQLVSLGMLDLYVDEDSFIKLVFTNLNRGTFLR